MIGRVRFEEGRSRIHWEQELLHGIAVCSVTFYEPETTRPELTERRLRKMEKLFRNEGVTRVLLPSSFPYRHLLRQVQPVSVGNLYRCFADLLVLEILKRRGIDQVFARVALMGPRLCLELCETAKRLCRAVREVRIDVPSGEGARFARLLQREYGLPVMPSSAAVDAVVCFGPERGADLILWGDEPDLYGMRLAAENIEVPYEIEQPMLALLWEQGRLRRGDVYVVNVP